MRQRLKFPNWIDDLSGDARAIRSIHLDQLCEYDPDGLKGKALAEYMVDLIDDFSEYVKYNKIFKKNETHIVIFIPLICTDELLLWNDRIYNEIGNDEEPASVYIYYGEDIFGNDLEEYRKPIDGSFKGRDGLLIIFRSFRDRNAIDNQWEFTNGIYLVKKI